MASAPAEETQYAAANFNLSSFYENIEASSKLCIRFLSYLCKNGFNTVLGRNLFSIANDYFVNPSDLSKMLVKKTLSESQKHLLSPNHV